MTALTHTTAYQFLDCSEDETLRESLQETCARLQLVGSITLAQEGINLSLVGEAEAVDRMEQLLLTKTPFEGLQFRHSHVAAAPFSKLIVRQRPNLLSVQMETPVAERRPGERLPPQRLREWLDENRSIRLLDVRNLYETRLGKFRGTATLPLHRFRDFEIQAKTFAPDARPLVTYCTGGIRCELASAWLREQGHEDIWQLSGGVLHYLERCDGHHWEGECFVFDNRLAVDAQLQATYPKLCRACQKPWPDAKLDQCPECGAPRGAPD